MGSECLKTKSDENWQAAKLCRDNAFIHAATSRFYYALYQASRYWAAKRELVGLEDFLEDVHATMANIVGCNAGAYAREYRAVMNEMKDLRVRADYRPELLGDADVDEPVKKASVVRCFFLQ